MEIIKKEQWFEVVLQSGVSKSYRLVQSIGKEYITSELYYRDDRVLYTTSSPKRAKSFCWAIRQNEDHSLVLEKLRDKDGNPWDYNQEINADLIPEKTIILSDYHQALKIIKGYKATKWVYVLSERYSWEEERITLYEDKWEAVGQWMRLCSAEITRNGNFGGRQPDEWDVNDGHEDFMTAEYINSFWYQDDDSYHCTLVRKPIISDNIITSTQR